MNKKCKEAVEFGIKTLAMLEQVQKEHKLSQFLTQILSGSLKLTLVIAQLNSRHKCHLKTQFLILIFLAFF